MTTLELMEKINTVLLENGFDTEYDGTLRGGKAAKEGKVYIETIEGSKFGRKNGTEIKFWYVGNHNETREDMSVDIVIMIWKNGLSYTFAKERIKVDHSEKQFDNRMKKIIDAYNML